MLRNNNAIGVDFGAHKNAFTLAEVLITLSIIGVVAAMTLPNLIHKQQMMELENRFKVAYSTIFQAVQTMGIGDPGLWQTYCAKNSDPDTSVNRDSDYLFISEFSKQFQTVKLYPSDTHNINSIGYKQSYFSQTAKGKEKFNEDSYNNGAFVSKNGMVIASSGCWWANSLGFIVDTNGTKGPNKFGYDVFYFQIAKNNLLLPSNSNYSFGTDESQSPECCDLNDNSVCNEWDDNGAACSLFALKDRLPNDETKSYWKNLPKP